MNLRTMNSRSRADIEHRRRMFGKEFDGQIRTYVAINILEGIVEALERDSG